MWWLHKVTVVDLSFISLTVDHVLFETLQQATWLIYVILAKSVSN